MNAAAHPLSVSQLSLYNPARLSDEETVASFAARQAVFERILEDIRSEPARGRPQHHLIVGQRGMGKSTLLARLATELRRAPALAVTFIPLAFAEEQYAVDRLSKFWLNCLDSLADATERAGEEAAADRIDTLVRGLSVRIGAAGVEDTLAAAEALEAFLAEARALGRRPVLLVDNLQLVFDRTSEQEQHVLRELLMRPGAPILVGASPSPPPQSQDYGAAFYDHFKVHYLPPLSVEEMRQLMLTLAAKVGRADISERVLRHPHRLPVLRQLTGGNPRTTVTLFFLYAEDFAPSVFGDLENLLDRVTPLYKSRFEELAAQQQVVASAIANHWDPITARKLSEDTGLPPSAISAQLDRLEKIGFVERVELFGRSATGYQLAERFFNVWFLMRNASRRQRREVEFLTRFIESFYEAEDRSRLALQIQSERDLSPDRHLFTRALACTVSPDLAHDLRRHAELDALRQKNPGSRRRLTDVIDLDQVSPTTQAFSVLRERLSALVPGDAGVSTEEFATLVLGDVQLFRSGGLEKLAAAQRGSAQEVAELVAVLRRRREDAARVYGSEAADWVARRLASGQLLALDDPLEWKAAINQAPNSAAIHWLLQAMPRAAGQIIATDLLTRIEHILGTEQGRVALTWFSKAQVLGDLLDRYPEAETAYRQGIALDDRWAPAWQGLGNLLLEHTDRPAEAETAYRRALALDGDAADTWRRLGDVLQYGLARYEEAESAYRRAIALDGGSAGTWLGLGDLLALHLTRYGDAEAAYRQTTALAEKWALPWVKLGSLLYYTLDRTDEAEAAYRRAVELDAGSAMAWSVLGDLLRDCQGRGAEAEAAYRQAIAFDESWAPAWNGLGAFYAEQPGRQREAEAAFRRAIELDAGWALPWDNLGDLLATHGDRYGEAEGAYRRAMALDPKWALPWHSLGDLLANRLDRFEEAAAAYRQAIALDGEWPWAWISLGNLLQFRLKHFEDAEASYRQAIAVDAGAVWAWVGLGWLLLNDPKRLEEAEECLARSLELDAAIEAPLHGLVSLRRDYRGDPAAAAPLLARLAGFPKLAGQDLYHLHRAVSALYVSEWDAASEEFAKALDLAAAGIPPLTTIGWMRSSAVILHLNYGSRFVELLRERGDDARLRPWYEALKALEAGDRRYLQNLAPEVRPVAEVQFDEIERRLQQLPEHTRRRPLPEAPKPSRKRRRGR
jgi:tetratricopeptide (TPR) repeat protein